MAAVSMKELVLFNKDMFDLRWNCYDRGESSVEEAGVRAVAMEIGYLRRMEAVEVMIDGGVIQKLVQLLSSEAVCAVRGEAGDAVGGGGRAATPTITKNPFFFLTD
ncbi:hypothetical protein SASPL_120863 [Salvia splendens]|uniref:Uncharacterized protein n=1 Tax=Salvia splendens TaxID=180675 RepID=A0A8X8XTV3_SALSN|nr:hypothetical protein SASPL_120863 [Salvia splendens]